MATAVSAVNPLEIKGIDFVDPNTGNKVVIVGAAYQPGGSAAYNPKETGKDALSDADTCKRDAALLQVMGVNAIRIYNLSPDLNHDECASIFNAAGIYMMLDVNSPLVGESLSAWHPWESYYTAYMRRTFAIVEAFSEYPNTLAFFSANEVIAKKDTIDFAPRYIRAVTRDLKNYIKNNLKRKIPVGYSAADVRDVLWDTWNYLQCSIEGEKDDMSRADFFALNSYSWCGPDATFESSSYNDLVDGLKSTSVPVFFSEYGCNTPKPRYWNETQSLYGKDMIDVFAGGVVYEYTEEENEYGLVNITSGTLNVLSDFNRLKAQYAKIDWKSIQSQKAKGKGPSAPKCVAKLIQEKGFDSNFTLPVTPPKGDKDAKSTQGYIESGIDNKPKGKLVKINNFDVTLKINDADGKEIKGLKVVPLASDEFNWYGKNQAQTGSATDDEDKDDKDDKKDDKKSGDAKTDEANSDSDSAAGMSQPLMWAAAVPLVAMLFA
jgi:hypothetical protein